MPDETLDPRLAALALIPAGARPSPDPAAAASELASDLFDPLTAAELVIDLEALAAEQVEDVSLASLAVEEAPAAVEPAPLVVVLPPVEDPVPGEAYEVVPALGTGRESATTLPESEVLYRTPILVGLPQRRAALAIEELGVRVIGAGEAAIRWQHVSSIDVRKAEVVISGKGSSIRFGLDVHGVPEPTLAAPFARVLEEARTGSFDLGGSAFHDLANTIDSLPDRFHETEDPVILAVLAGAMTLLTLILALLVPDMLRILTQAPVTTGGFLIGSRLSALDPRVAVVALGGAGLLTAAAARAALGPQALVWARGALRGWQRGGPVVRSFSRALGALVLLPGAGAALVLVGVLLAVPSARVQTIVDAGGVLSMRELPLFDSHRTWGSVTHIVEIPAPVEPGRHEDGIAVVIHFVQGSPLNTYDLTIRNGSDRQLYDLSQQWREQALRPTR